MNKILLSCIALLFISCADSTVTPSRSTKVKINHNVFKPILYRVENEIKPNTEPDPQAKNRNLCLNQLSSYKESIQCLKNNKVHISSLGIYPKHNRISLGLTRGASDIQKINIKGKTLVLIRINTLANIPSYINVKHTVSGEVPFQTIIIEVKDITVPSIIMKSASGKTLLKYEITSNTIAKKKTMI